MHLRFNSRLTCCIRPEWMLTRSAMLYSNRHDREITEMTANSSIQTIGYGARSLPDVLELLVERGVTYLLDVRSSPYSRYNPDFSQHPLQQRASERGLVYVFLGDSLGGRPENPDSYADGRVDYERMAQSESFQGGLARLKTIHQKQIPAVLLCSEVKPEMCHRTKLIGEELAKAGILISHIDADGTVVSHVEVMRRVTGAQLPMLAELAPPLRSRKRYLLSGAE